MAFYHKHNKKTISLCGFIIDVIERTPSVLDKRLDRTDLSRFWARLDSAKTITQPDVDFMTGMIGHLRYIMSSMASVKQRCPSIVILTKQL